MDWQENIFIREGNYSGQKKEWKTIIKNQLLKHLREIGVEEGFAKSKTRYFQVTKEQHFPPAEYVKKLLNLIDKVKRIEQ